MAIGKRINVVTGEVTTIEYTPEPYVEPEKSYQELRKAEYPPIEDYIDGIVKGDTAQVQAYIDACLAVKAKYPKPEPIIVEPEPEPESEPVVEESKDEISG